MGRIKEIAKANVKDFFWPQVRSGRAIKRRGGTELPFKKLHIGKIVGTVELAEIVSLTGLGLAKAVPALAPTLAPLLPAAAFLLEPITVPLLPFKVLLVFLAYFGGRGLVGALRAGKYSVDKGRRGLGYSVNKTRRGLELSKVGAKHVMDYVHGETPEQEADLRKAAELGNDIAELELRRELRLRRGENPNPATVAFVAGLVGGPTDQAYELIRERRGGRFIRFWDSLKKLRS